MVEVTSNFAVEGCYAVHDKYVADSGRVYTQMGLAIMLILTDVGILEFSSKHSSRNYYMLCISTLSITCLYTQASGQMT